MVISQVKIPSYEESTDFDVIIQCQRHQVFTHRYTQLQHTAGADTAFLPGGCDL